MSDHKGPMFMDVNDGGPAFPMPGLSGLPNDQFLYGEQGMTLRAYIAAKAMHGLLIEGSTMTIGYVIKRLGLPEGTPYDPVVHWPQYVAQRAVEHADALLAQLAKESNDAAR